MGEPKAFASLSSGLLARKGAARPAMRPQGFGQVGAGLEDLGWNDMGFEAPKPALAPVRDDHHEPRRPLRRLSARWAYRAPRRGRPQRAAFGKAAQERDPHIGFPIAVRIDGHVRGVAVLVAAVARRALDA